MPWKETSVENIRFEFIQSLERKEGSMAEVCEAFGVSRKTGYKWLARYQERGKAGLSDQSRAPVFRPRDTSPELEAAIISTQCRHPYYGAKKLRAILQREQPKVSWPSVTTFSNILKRNGFTTRRRKRPRLAGAAPLENCYAANDVWTADFKGWWRTGDGATCEPLTVIDSYSRFLLNCGHVQRRDFHTVWSQLRETFEEYGMPKRLRTDNGCPFASTSVGRLSRLSVRLIRLGIIPEWISPGKPQENGRHERMHRSLKLEAATPPSSSLTEQDSCLSRWMHTYNFVRPHEALDMATPSDLYIPSRRVWTGEENDPTYPDGYCERRVDKTGVIKWRGSKVFTSELLRHQSLGLEETSNGLVRVHFGPILLGTVDPLHGFRRT